MGAFDNCCFVTGAPLHYPMAFFILERQEGIWRPASYPILGSRDIHTGGLEVVPDTPYQTTLLKEVSTAFRSIPAFVESLHGLPAFTGKLAQETMDAQFSGGRLPTIDGREFGCAVMIRGVFEAIMQRQRIVGALAHGRFLLEDFQSDRRRLELLCGWLERWGISWKPIDAPRQYSGEKTSEKIQRAMDRFAQEEALVAALEEHAAYVLD